MFARYFLPILYYQLANITIFEEIYASLVAQRLKRLPGMQETWVQSLGWEDGRVILIIGFRILKT